MPTIWTPDLTLFPGPKYLALARALREAIGSGVLNEGARLPTVRDLAWAIHATPGTVARAYQLATHEGLLAATVGRGTFVAARSPRLGPTQALSTDRDPARLADRIDLRSPQLPDVGQAAAFSRALEGLAAQGGPDWRDYPTQHSDAALRGAICDWVGHRVLGPVLPRDVTLCHGGQNAIGLILQCCLRGDRPVVLIEELAYPGFRHAARLARAEVVTVEIDAKGMVPDALEAACRKHGPQVLCLTVEAQNPTTARMPPERREALVAIARAHGLQIIEDDCYSVADSRDPTLRALAPERTWHVGGWSKTVSAALRFGYVIGPAEMTEGLRLTAQHGFFGLSRLVVDLCQSLIESGAADRIRSDVQTEFAARLDRVVTSLAGHDIAWQPGLPFVWLRLPSGWRASNFTCVAEAEGVLVRSADEYAPLHGRAPNAIRLAIAGGVPRADFDEGMATLAHLLVRPPGDLAV